MVRLVIVKNPFEPWNGRTVKSMPYGFTARQMVDATEFKGVEIQCSVNGNTVEMSELYVPPDNSIIVLSPVVGKGGGGKILGIVAMVALAVVSFGVGAAAGTTAGMWGAGMASWSAWGYLAAAATLFVGSTLIQRCFTSSPSMGKYESSTTDPTYSWSGVETMEGQNNSIAITYGKVLTGGQTIGKFVKVEDNKEYLNWLISAGEGPLSYSDIKLNDNAIGYYSGVTLETREGTNCQSVISNFNDTYFTKNLGYQLLDGYRTEACQGNATQGIAFKIEFSNGLYHANDKGGLDKAWVDVYAEYRRVGGSWTPVWRKQIVNKIVNGGPGGITANSSAADGNYTINYIFDDSDYSYSVRIRYPNGDRESRWVYVGDPDKVGNFTINVDGLPRRDCEYTFNVTSSSHYEGTTTRITGSQSSALRKEYFVHNLSSGEYEVRIKANGRSHKIDDSRSSVRCYWNSLTSIVYDDFCYPNIGLIAIKALATDQISGSPKLTFLKERKYVWVYVPGSGYQQKPANNPAWASYDMLHQAQRLQNVHTGAWEFDVRGAAADILVYNQFAEWAAFCDSKQLRVNIEINRGGELLDVINGKIANCGRGVVIRFGTKYGCVWNCVKQPVQMFGMGNIISGTYQEEFLQTSDRANCVEVTFVNADHDYEREVITIYSDSYDDDPEEKTAQVTYDGITNYNQAYREGKYQLYANKYQLRTCSFEANVDAIACTIGDVILVAHDVPKWAYSGRIYEVDTENSILTLPVSMSSTEGSWRIMYRTLNDKLCTSSITILENENGWCKVRCSEPFTSGNMPAKDDIFDIALANIGSKPFVVTNITRAQDFTRRINCIEYAEALFNENYTIPPVQYSMNDNKRAKNVTKLTGNQITYNDDSGQTCSKLFVSWEIPNNGGRFNVLISTDKVKWTNLVSGLSEDSYEAQVEYGSSYYIKVITTLGISVSSGVTIGPIAPGPDVLPPDVKFLDTELLANGTRRFWWQFDYPNPNDIAGFKIKYVQGSYPNWSNAYDLHTGLITAQPFETDALRQGVHTVLIKAIDNSGQESKNAAYTVLNLGDLLEENVLARDDVGVNGWTKTFNNGLISTEGYLMSRSNVAFWTSPENNFWTKSSKDFWIERYKGFNMTYQYIAPASGQFWIDYDIEGPAQIKYLICGKETFWKTPEASFWSEPKKVYWDIKGNQYIPYTGKIMVNAGEQIQIAVVAPDNISEATIVKHLELITDVPDRQEHFENLRVPVEGIRLNIKTPHYHTTAVRIDAVQGSNMNNVFRAVVVEKNPCKIQVVDVNYNPIEAVVDVTWQGYIKEVL